MGLITKCVFHSAIPTFKVGSNFQDINKLNMVKLSLQKWQTIYCDDFRPNPNSESQQMEIDRLPQSNQGSFGFDNEISALQNSCDRNPKTNDFEIIEQFELEATEIDVFAEEESDNEYAEYSEPRDESDEDMEEHNAKTT